MIEGALFPVQMIKAVFADGVATSEAHGQPRRRAEVPAAHRTVEEVRPLRSLDRHSPEKHGRTNDVATYTNCAQ